MKIIAIGRNYVEHAKELANPIPASPVIFMKPDTAVIKNNLPFYYPEFSTDIHHEIEVVLKICREGKFISEKFAHRYYDAVGLGIDFTARDIQSQHKKNGLPWELAKAFDGSAPISTFIPISEIEDMNQIHFDLKINGELKQDGNTKDLIFSFDQLIAFVSKYITLKKGDLLFTGTPAGVGNVHIGDRLKASLNGMLMLDFEIK